MSREDHPKTVSAQPIPTVRVEANAAERRRQAMAAHPSNFVPTGR